MLNNSPLVCKGRHGSLSMERQERIVICRFTGAINQTVLKFFSENIATVVGDLQGTPWGYLSSSALAEASTPDSEDLMVKGGKLVLGLGCVKAAYVLTSPVAIAQTRKAREMAGAQQPLEEIMFENEDEAKRFLNEQLLQHINPDGKS